MSLEDVAALLIDRGLSPRCMPDEEGWEPLVQLTPNEWVVLYMTYRNKR